MITRFRNFPQYAHLDPLAVLYHTVSPQHPSVAHSNLNHITLFTSPVYHPILHAHYIMPKAFLSPFIHSSIQVSIQQSVLPPSTSCSLGPGVYSTFPAVSLSSLPSLHLSLFHS
ncbi:hypothetical protein E2C01_097773 [Portunus trituberculatus]|uniref:Uncharacterized protein n=1 Tax=Portunus trituberculatus TaxID=210409 RepID=A0A5B7K5P7_PORTR|nr:hypothetical protein [Portunus trituberculatus]